MDIPSVLDCVDVPSLLGYTDIPSVLECMAIPPLLGYNYRHSVSARLYEYSVTTRI